jgi:hypothetical protein
VWRKKDILTSGAGYPMNPEKASNDRRSLSEMPFPIVFPLGSFDWVP